MSSWKVFAAALGLVVGLTACGNQSQSPLSSAPATPQGALGPISYSWCFIHDKSVEITLKSTSGGVDVYFTVANPELVAYLRTGVSVMAGLSPAYFAHREQPDRSIVNGWIGHRERTAGPVWGRSGATLV